VDIVPYFVDVFSQQKEYVMFSAVSSVNLALYYSASMMHAIAGKSAVSLLQWFRMLAAKLLQCSVSKSARATRTHFASTIGQVGSNG